ncbi:MAG: LON peptidase substrate-binding domain-containing protein [Planctomycetes bacterium]|nr:LON peptidase substrate-binding domain-containing protein [Planctomycetota bacterium]MCH9727129.1 LON peptidase substrate-binding domain-containing protein [Planctomycetota bacterium]MCH9778522.1 LON peptidase substrate-binding domain-containing protein [Planctomycetota bacterium]MCH9789451.1 LON peptidase substrate-binding domain-containing protein [Planctomycetota bacterium]MDF1744803.1 LON peptidase substrate-binding domain-containing protein [Gimesia sp.]
MSSYSDPIEQQLKTFTGIVPVLELEESVLLPHSQVLLRMTAAADCQLISDAINENALVAVALKQAHNNSQLEMQQSASVDIVCLASIVSPYQLESGEYSILLKGICRARAVVLQGPGQTYRRALLAAKPDFYADQPMIHREHRQLELLEHYAKIFLQHSGDSTYYHLLHREISLGKLCDTLASTINMEPVLRQLILEEHDVDLRSDLLLDFLKNHLRYQQPNPFANVTSIPFSQN